MLDFRQQFPLDAGQLAQRGNLVDPVKIRGSVRGGQKPCPGSQNHQLIETVPALPDECLRPPPGVSTLRHAAGSVDEGGRFRGGGRQPVQGQPCLRKRGRSGPGREIHVLAKLGELGRRGVFRNVPEDPQRVAQPFEQARSQDFVIGKRDQTLPERQQMAREIPAVNRRNVEGQQRLQGLRVVPVIEVAPVPFQGFHCVQGAGRAVNELSG